MRLAVFSDIHGNLAALEAVLADMERAGSIDRWWCLGDLAAHGPRPAECLARLRALREQHGKEVFQVIGGNTDRYLVTGERFPLPAVTDAALLAARVQSLATRDRVLNWNVSVLSYADYEFLAQIIGRELQQRVEGYGTLIGFHAIPGNDESLSLLPATPEEEAHDALLDRAGRLALAGHTHQVMDRTLQAWRVINPGSVGMSLTQHGYAEWALLTVTGDGVQVDFRAVPYDVAAVIADARVAGHPDPDWLADWLRTTA
ncbi:MAG: metallophosphatase family protein [Anaerolineae bacterium]|nr:metallophosphatase family protein [Anaerolineae bacterium]